MFLKKRKRKGLPLDISTREGFEQIYRTHIAGLFEIAYYRLRDEGAAKCIVHQVFCTLWERRLTLDLKGPVEHYLVRAVKLAIMDHIRIEVNRRKNLERVLADKHDSDLSTENQLNYSELLDRVSLLVDQLPPQRQQVYKLSREKGMNNKEIAASLLIAEKTVEGHLSKALKFLRLKLREYY